MANRFISAAELDFETRLASLKAYLKSQDRFNDYNFDGSNWAVVLDVLAQNSYLHGFFLNMLGSEAFLDSAVLRESLVSRAKELNYLPRSRTSARAVIDIVVVPNDNPYQITIPKGYAFRAAASNNQTTNFVVGENTVITPSNGVYKASNVTIYEGVLVTEVFTVDSNVDDNGYYQYESEFNLQSENIDASSIEVYIQPQGDTSFTQLSRAQSLFGLSSESQVFFVEGYSANQYKVVLGDGLLGAGFASGSKVKVVYRDTLGGLCNGLFSFIKTSSIDGYGSISITTKEAAYGGSERESNQSIQFNAPRHFQVQQRAVVPADYEALIRENFPEIQAVSVYGGERIKKYGRVIIVVKPAGINSTISQSLRARMTEFLADKNITAEPVFAEPDYFYLGIDSKVYYDRNLTIQNTATTRSAVVNSLIALNDTMFNNFGTDVRPSKIEAIIDSTDPSINGNATTYTFIKRLFPTVNVLNQISISFGNAINHDSVLNNYPLGHQRGIVSNDFQVLVDDVITTVHLADDGQGKLYLYQLLSTNTDYVPIGTSIGSVDYDTGDVQIGIMPSGYTTSIEIRATLKSREIVVDEAKFVVIDGKDITVTMVVDNR